MDGDDEDVVRHRGREERLDASRYACFTGRVDLCEGLLSRGAKVNLNLKKPCDYGLSSHEAYTARLGH